MGIHILGICGTFMGGVALLAKESGLEVSGSDENVYPPMSTLLESNGIAIKQGLKQQHIENYLKDSTADKSEIVIGNVMTRGMEAVEYVLNNNLTYTSGPQWLYENILRDRWVIAVSGTHGKTTTASMIAWILEYAGMNPGFLIGGVPDNFGLSARLGDSPFFVVEADEYDTAFFDKRSKFVHYHPKTLVINNLEFDHADIFENLDAIKKQFHHLLRMVPGQGLILSNSESEDIDDVLEMGCWTPVEKFSAKSGGVSKKGWQANYIQSDGSEFEVILDGEIMGAVDWPLLGQHNVSNALAAIAASRHAGVPIKHAIDALKSFKGVKRRMELKCEVNGVKVYDDFAHHPTAIATTLQGLREKVGSDRIIAVLEPRSNTMRMGVHQQTLHTSLAEADEVILYEPEGLDWNLQETAKAIGEKAVVFNQIDQLVESLANKVNKSDNVLVMSNGGFAGIHQKLIDAIAN